MKDVRLDTYSEDVEEGVRVLYVGGRPFPADSETWLYAEGAELDPDTCFPGADGMFSAYNGDDLILDLSRVTIGGTGEPDSIRSYSVEWDDGTAREAVEMGMVPDWRRRRHAFQSPAVHRYGSDEVGRDNWDLHPCILIRVRNGLGESAVVRIYYRLSFPSLRDEVSSLQLEDVRLCNDGTPYFTLKVARNDGESFYLPVKGGADRGVRTFRREVPREEPEVPVSDEPCVWEW